MIWVKEKKGELIFPPYHIWNVNGGENRGF